MPLNTQGKKQQFPEIMTAKAGAELATNLQGFLNCDADAARSEGLAVAFAVAFAFALAFGLSS